MENFDRYFTLRGFLKNLLLKKSSVCYNIGCYINTFGKNEVAIRRIYMVQKKMVEIIARADGKIQGISRMEKHRFACGYVGLSWTRGKEKIYPGHILAEGNKNENSF